MKYFILSTILILTGAGVLMVPNTDALTVSPVKLEITGDPGQTLNGELILKNDQDIAKTFYSSFENFEARGETGTPHFLPGKEGLATWIAAPAQVTLGPGEQKIILFTIQIPRNVEPGGHFGAIFWSTSPPQVQGGGQISVSAKTGILVLLRVTGEIEGGGGLLEFKTEGGRVLTSLPITFVYRFSNDGGDRIKPEGEIRIKNIIGMTSAVLPANKSEGNVLPGSIRKFTVIWGVENPPTGEEEEGLGFFGTVGRQLSDFHLGLYNAKLSLEYAGETNESSFRFFIIPWQLLSIVLVVLAIFGFIGKVGIKRYNQWILKKA